MRAEGEVDDTDVIGRAMPHDPLHAPYQGGNPASPVAVEHPDVDDVGLRRDPHELAGGAASIPGDDARDVRSVTAGVAHEAIAGEVDRREDPVRRLRKVRVSRDARVEDRDRPLQAVER